MLQEDGRGRQDWRLANTQKTDPVRKWISVLCSEDWVDSQESRAKMDDEICTPCPLFRVSMGVTCEGFQEAGEVEARSTVEFRKDDGRQEGGKPVG